MNLKKVLSSALALSLSISVITSCNEDNQKGKAEAGTNNKSVCVSPKEIDKNKLKEKLSIFGSNFEIVKVDKSPLDNLYKVVIKSGGRYAVLYIDCKLEYLIIGSMLELKSKRDLTREVVFKYQMEEQSKKLEKLKSILGEEKFEQLKKVLGMNISTLKIVNLGEIPKEGTIIYGNPNAKYTIYIISDPECPFCAKLHESIKEIIAKDKDVKFEIILFPLSFHRYAKGIAENIASQTDMEKRRELLDKSFSAVIRRDIDKLKELSKGNEKGAKILEKHKEFSKSVNLRGTPMIIFPEGIAISGAIPTDILYKLIQILKK